MTFQEASIEALKQLTASLNKDPAGKRAIEEASAELAEFLDRHQYHGEAAVMIAALTLAQDEQQ